MKSIKLDFLRKCLQITFASTAMATLGQLPSRKRKEIYKARIKQSKESWKSSFLPQKWSDK